MSAEQYYGIDFGTSNSSVSIKTNSGVQTLTIGRGNNREILETAIYFSSSKILYSSEAIEQYLQEIRGQKPATNSIDYNIGRLIRSFKSAIGSNNLSKTRIGDQTYDLIQIIGIFLKEIKTRADILTGKEINRVVLGRPVKFVAESDDMDQTCSDRLRQAAELAGFNEVEIEYEPVAAAYSFHKNGLSEKVLVFDFGGGTLDISVVEFDGVKSKVLAVAGEALGGDNLDMDLYFDYLAKYFGQNLRYKSSNLHYPRYAVEQIVDWSRIVNLRNEEFMSFLKQIYHSASDPDTVRFIEDFLVQNLTYSLRESITKAKIDLSSGTDIQYHFKTRINEINELLTEDRFKQMIDQYKTMIVNLVEETLRKAGAENNQISSVVMTGGSSLIPSVQTWLVEMFGKDRIKIHDPFSAISKGLAIMG